MAAPPDTTLDPKLDLVFKLLFADPRNQRLLVSLLTAVLRPAVPLTGAVVLNPGLPESLGDPRGAWLDLLVRLADGRRLDVRLRTYAEPTLLRCDPFRWLGLCAADKEADDSPTQLDASIGIFILGFVHSPRTRFHSEFRILEVGDREPFSGRLDVHVIELTKVPERSEQEPELVRWGKFLAAGGDAERRKLAHEDAVIHQAYAALALLSHTPEVQALARQREVGLAGYRLNLEAAEMLGLAQGRADGWRRAVARLSSALGFELDEERRRALDAMPEAKLEELVEMLGRERRWPEG